MISWLWDLWVCSYPLGWPTFPFLFVFLNSIFARTSVWSLPMSAPLNAPASCIVPLHLLFISIWSIWFCVWQSGEVHVNLWMFFVLENDTSYNKLVFFAKVLNMLPLLLIIPQPCFPIVDSFPSLCVPTFALRSPNMRSTSWTDVSSSVFYSSS